MKNLLSTNSVENGGDIEPQVIRWTSWKCRLFLPPNQNCWHFFLLFHIESDHYWWRELSGMCPFYLLATGLFTMELDFCDFVGCQLSYITSMGFIRVICVCVSFFFVSNFRNGIEIEGAEERYNCADIELPNWLICDLKLQAQSMTWRGVTWPWTRGQTGIWPLLSNKTISSTPLDGRIAMMTLRLLLVELAVKTQTPTIGLLTWPFNSAVYLRR